MTISDEQRRAALEAFDSRTERIYHFACDQRLEKKKMRELIREECLLLDQEIRTLLHGAPSVDREVVEALKLQAKQQWFGTFEQWKKRVSAAKDCLALLAGDEHG